MLSNKICVKYGLVQKCKPLNFIIMNTLRMHKRCWFYFLKVFVLIKIRYNLKVCKKDEITDFAYSICP